MLENTVNSPQAGSSESSFSSDDSYSSDSAMSDNEAEAPNKPGLPFKGNMAENSRATHKCEQENKQESSSPNSDRKSSEENAESDRGETLDNLKEIQTTNIDDGNDEQGEMKDGVCEQTGDDQHEETSGDQVEEDGVQDTASTTGTDMGETKYKEITEESEKKSIPKENVSDIPGLQEIQERNSKVSCEDVMEAETDMGELEGELTIEEKNEKNGEVTVDENKSSDGKGNVDILNATATSECREEASSDASKIDVELGSPENGDKNSREAVTSLAEESEGHVTSGPTYDDEECEKEKDIEKERKEPTTEHACDVKSTSLDKENEEPHSKHPTEIDTRLEVDSGKIKEELVSDVDEVNPKESEMSEVQIKPEKEENL